MIQRNPAPVEEPTTAKSRLPHYAALVAIVVIVALIIAFVG